MSTPEAPQPGPCSAWITAEDVADACEALDTSGGVEAYEPYALEASQVLFELSGRRFTGLCGPITVRPCEPGAYCSPAHPCGCCFLSRIRLSGYPVRQVVEVKIDGALVDPAEYRLDRYRYLARLPDADGQRQRWPACQRLDLDDTEEGTFSVSYTYGQEPPLAGLNAAQELACQLAAASPEGDGGECELPEGTVRVTRQGVTIDMERFVEEGIAALPAVALFLQAYNPNRLRRRSAVWTPDVPGFPQQVG